MPKVKINDVEVDVPAGTNMIEAARLAGEEIPHYCYHPHLSIAGNCRMCLVDIVGGRAPDIACNMTAREGLAIRTDTDNVKTMRKSVMEFLLVNHPLDCPICDQSGECRLQDYYMEYGQYDSRGVEEKISKHKRQDIAELIVLDAERCVQCSRCVRFGDEVTGTGELRLFNRTDHTEIGMFPGERITHHYQGNLADICPVGALTNKDFRFERRVWYLRETESICTGCATGCNIRICAQEGNVFRYLPRRNDAVNKSWMCDDGRQSYTKIGSVDRILRARLEGAAVDPLVAIEAIARRIKALGASKVGFVLGAKATNEANWALLQVARKNLADARVFWVDGNDPTDFTYADTILVSADKNPNTTGVKLLVDHDPQIGDRAALLEALPSLELLVVLEDDIVGRLGAAFPPIAYFGPRRNATAAAATILVPVAHTAEMDGSYTNRDGRVQRVRRAIAPAGDSQAAYLAVDQIGTALGTSPGCSMPAAAFNGMARAVRRMNGMEFKALGSAGLPLAPEPAPAAPAAEATV
jgi:NADH-quinone oxidoreductase subunit G